MGPKKPFGERSIEQLAITADSLLVAALAPSTQDNYRSAFSRYEAFCTYHKLQPIPSTEETLILFATELSYTHAHSSIKVHLSAIAYHLAIKHHPLDFKRCRRLYYLMRGIKRTQGRTRRRRKRAPITPKMLKDINIRLFNSSRVYEDKIMLWAALLTGFYGFLRVSEYTSARKTTFDPDSTLLFSDMMLKPDGSVSLLIKTSKTDPFRQGVVLRIAKNDSSLCPVNALRHLTQCHPTKSGPLFTFANGRFLSRRDVNNLLLEKTDKRMTISSHSLRIGAASTAAAAGCPKWLIQALGRWSSDCFRNYIRIPKKTIDNTSRILARCTIKDIKSFDPDTLENASLITE